MAKLKQSAIVVKKSTPAKTTVKTTSSSDTTVIKKPYKVMYNELQGSISNAKTNIIDVRKGLPLADTSVKKMKYNREIAIPSTRKRNVERLKEGKKMIPYSGSKGGSALGVSVGLSKTGKTFKEAPLKVVKKK